MSVARYAFFCLLVAGGATRADTVGDVLRAGSPVPARTEVQASADKARAAYAAFLRGGADSPHRATALRRLADLELDAALLAMETGATVSFDSAIRLYEEFLDRFEDDPAREQALYQLSRALDLAGEPAAALTRLRTLTNDYPDSTLAPEAWFRQGEMLFLARDYSAAALAYGTVYGTTNGTRFETNARYKKAWSLFKLGDLEQSVTAFAGLADHVLDGETPVTRQIEVFSPGQREMFDDALRATSIALADLGGAGYLDEVFDDRALPPWTWLFYARLGEHYLATERYADAAGSFAAFVRRAPTDAQAPILAARVIETYEAAGFASRVLEARADFVRRYGPEAAFWQGRTPADHPAVVAQLDRHLEALTRHYHALAQDDGGTGAVDAAAGWYRTWLAYFPDADAAPARHFLLAELLFDADRFAAAAIAYERTAYGYGIHERAAEAGYAALLAHDRARDAAGPEAAADHRELALEARLRFAGNWPDDPRSPAVLLSAAEELFAAGRLTEAVSAADRALQTDAGLDNTQRRTALVVQAHAHFDLGGYAAAASAYSDALTLTGPQDELLQPLRERLAASHYEQGRAARETGDLTAATLHFKAIDSLGFETSVHPVALNDAAAALIETARWDEAAAALEALRDRYPEHDLSDGIAERLTGVYLQGERPLEAAAELAGIARTGDPGTALAARWQAAALYSDNGDDAAYRQMLESLARDAATPPDDAMRARERLVTVSLEANDAPAVRYWREAIIDADAEAGTSRSDYSRTLAAHAALALAEPLGAAFDSVELTLPLAASVPAKKSALETSLAAYRRVADYAVDATSTAATYRIAELYRQFGVALMQSERPPELDELALEEYELLLEEQAFPFEEKAIEIHEINTARAAAHVWDEWVARSYDRLALLLPARYDRGERRASIFEIMD